MHKVKVNYLTTGYRVTLECDLTHGCTEIALIQDPADTFRYAKWKGTELGIPVVLCQRLEEILEIAKKEIIKIK